MADEESLTIGNAALRAGQWETARAAFEACLAERETPEACFGLAVASWWLGDSHASVRTGTRAYSLYRRAGDVDGAVQCAVWLSIAYKANFGNAAAANGWLGRADRLAESLEPGLLHGWVNIARAYRMADLEAAETLTEHAAHIARDVGDVDLELVAMAQLGLIRVGRGETAAGFALIDEAVAAALSGERGSLDTVVYACCDMLNACELANDVVRATEWCRVADEFVESYGCPFLYAECRIYYGSVLTATGRWRDAERELGVALRITEDACPGLHHRALTRLAGLRIRQGRLEEAEQLMSSPRRAGEVEAEVTISRAALQLARGDAAAASRTLEHRLHLAERHRVHHTAALHLLTEAYIALGDAGAAEEVAERLTGMTAPAAGEPLAALVESAKGRVAAARGDLATGIAHHEAALGMWSRLGFPFEIARSRFDLARVMTESDPDAAVEHARQALTGFESLGAKLDTDRVAAFLRSLGEATRAGPRGVGTLTARELEVLELLALGLSNPEIAARLFLSRKTVSHHVSRVLSKLNLRNRAEAAGYAARELAPSDPTTS